jgi:hypothetical protein
MVGVLTGAVTDNSPPNKMRLRLLRRQGSTQELGAGIGDSLALSAETLQIVSITRNLTIITSDRISGSAVQTLYSIVPSSLVYFRISVLAQECTARWQLRRLVALAARLTLVQYIFFKINPANFTVLLRDK